MKKKAYTVTVTRTRIVTVDIEVEAASFDEAESLALEGAKVGRYEIDFNECEGSNEDEYELGESWCTDREEDDERDERLNEYANWEALVVTNLARQIDCTYSDAQGIIEAQEFCLAQSWAKGLTPQETARIIDEKSKA